MSEPQPPAQPGADAWDTAPIPRVVEQPWPNPPHRRAQTRPKPRNRQKLLLQGLGLVAIAVLSGVLWYLLNTGSDPADKSGGSGGKYAFGPVRGPVQDSDCGRNAYDDVARYFAGHPCSQLTRTLYASTPAANRKVLTSVAVVRMPDAATAAALKKLTDTDNTGNVDDLVRAGVSVPGAPDNLSGGGYASVRRGTLVVIVESDYLRDPPKRDEKLLVRVSEDALRLGKG